MLLPLVRRESIAIQFEGVYKYDWIMACNATKYNNITFWYYLLVSIFKL
jgi:hypothetical protein